MTCAQPEDLEIIAGNNHPPGMWQFLESENPDVIFPIDGSQFYLSIKWPNDEITVNTLDNPAELVIDEDSAIVSWNYSVATSRMLPKGRIASYELERRIDGTQQTFIGGKVVVSGGINVD